MLDMGRTSDAKQRLVEVAIRLIWERSYGSVSVDRICKDAGVNKGSFYHYFPSKELLALEALDYNWRKGEEMIFKPSFTKDLPPLERFNHFCESLYKVNSEMKEECGGVLGCPFGNLASEVGVGDEPLRSKVQEIYMEICSYFREALIDAVDEGVIKDLDPALTARTLVAYEAGVLLQAKVYNDVEVLRLLAPGMAELIGAGVKDGRLAPSSKLQQA